MDGVVVFGDTEGDFTDQWTVNEFKQTTLADLCHAVGGIGLALYAVGFLLEVAAQ